MADSRLHSALTLTILAWLAAPSSGQRLAPADPLSTFLSAADDPVARERARRVLIGHEDRLVRALEAPLSGDDPRLREVAVLTLLHAPPDAQLNDTLRAALEDEDVNVRIAAMRVLGARGLGDLPTAIERAAHSDLWSLRRAAALSIARCRDPRATSLLADLIHDPDPDVRAAATKSLIAAPNERAADLIAEVYDDLAPDDRVRALERMGDSDSAEALARLWRTADDEESPRLATVAAAVLAGRGATLLEGPRTARIVEFAISTDPMVREPAVFTLARDRPRASAAVEARLRSADSEHDGESLARLLVGLSGPQARPVLMAIARGEERASAAAVTGAINALRAFHTPQTTEDLAWIYTTELPLGSREGLCSAFEDLPRSIGARSGLLSVLRDPESRLRLRAFRLLVQYGASTRDEIEWLLSRLMEEKVPWVRDRMARLLASHADGEGARQFLQRWIRLLNIEGSIRQEATAALENLQDPRLLAEAGSSILDVYRGPIDLSLLRLLTRLRGERADRFVADALIAALDDDDPSLALGMLVALTQGGGPRCGDAAAMALEDDDPEVREQALRTLLRRGDHRALAAMRDRYATLSIDDRSELLSIARFDRGDETTDLLSVLLDAEPDPVVRATLIEKMADLRLDVADSILPFTTADHPPELRVRAIEALSAIGGDTAADRLLDLFAEAVSAEEFGGWRGDAMLLLESCARAAARTGRVEIASEMARVLLSRVDRLEPQQYDTDAAFTFEETILGALADLAAASDQASAVAAAIEQEVDRQAGTGDLFLFPKALFFRLANGLEKARPEFTLLRAEFLRLSLALPPLADRRELSSAVSLATLATEERDHATAARLLEHAELLIDYFGVEGMRFLRETLGAPQPLIGANPRLRLRADIELAWARHHRLTDAARGLQHYARAAAIAPHDAWLQLRIAGELIDDHLAPDQAVTTARRALELAPFEGDLVVRVARLLAEAGDAAGFDDARRRLNELRDCGLSSDHPLHRIGLAEALVRIGRDRDARSELEAAIALDGDAREWILADPRLRDLLEN